MLFIPQDLFSAWIKGREYGIDRNWNDLNQANNVERGWLTNDAQQLSNWFKQDTYGDQLARSNATARTALNSAAGSDLNLQLAQAQQPGALATAGVTSATQQALARAAQNNIPAYVGAQQNLWDANNVTANARAQALKEYGTQQLQNAARANAQNAQNAALQAEYFQDTLPLQQQVQRAELEAQRRLLQNAGQQTAVPVNTSAPVIDTGTYNSLIQSLAPGAVTTITGANGLPVTVGKANNGQLYYLMNGNQIPVTPVNAATSTTSTPFNYGELGTW